MEAAKEHQELMAKITELVTEVAVLKTYQEGEFRHINNHLASLNHKTAKNTGSIETLQERERNVLDIVANLKQQGQHYSKLEDERENRRDSWRMQWRDVMFFVIKWAIPITIAAILFRGREILEFFSLD